MSTSSVLNSLNYIDEVITESYVDVSNALLDSYMKQAEMGIIAEQCGIIQEGFDYKEGENILKTIFLYIPRLIVALIKTLRRKWKIYMTSKKFSKLGKELRELQSKLHGLKATYADILAKYNLSGDRYMFDAANNRFCLRTKIIDLDKCELFYKQMREAFESYKAAAEDAAKDFDFSAFDKPMYSNRINRSECMSPDITDVVITGVEINKIAELVKYQDETCDIIEKCMTSVEGWYKKAMATGAKTGETISNESVIAERILSDIRTLRESFTNFDTEFGVEIKIIHDAATKLKDALEAYVNSEDHKRNKEIIKEINKTREEMSGKLDDYVKTAEDIEAMKNNDSLKKFGAYVEKDPMQHPDDEDEE